MSIAAMTAESNRLKVASATDLRVSKTLEVAGRYDPAAEAMVEAWRSMSQAAVLDERLKLDPLVRQAVITPSEADDRLIAYSRRLTCNLAAAVQKRIAASDGQSAHSEVCARAWRRLIAGAEGDPA